MALPDSDPAPIFGAVFGFTESIDSSPDSKSFPSVSRRPPRQEELKLAAKTRQQLADTSGAATRKKRRDRRQRGLPKELLVTEGHLKSFDALHELLRCFHDPFASGNELKYHILEIPVLAGRLLRTARLTTGQLDLTDVGHALSLLGNKILEQELLQLLEDMTEVKADQEQGAP